MRERAGSHNGIAVRESGQPLGQDRYRLRRVLSEMRQTAAGGHKLIAETLAIMAATDALATESYQRLQKTIEVSTTIPVPGHPPCQGKTRTSR
jgi:hypothetical protein